MITYRKELHDKDGKFNFTAVAHCKVKKVALQNEHINWENNVL